MADSGQSMVSFDISHMKPPRTPQPLPLPFEVEDLNQVTIYQDGVLLVKGVHYTGDEEEVVLSGYNAEVGDIFTFIGTALAPLNEEVVSSNVLLSNLQEKFPSGVLTVEAALTFIMEAIEDLWEAIVPTV